MKKTLSYQKKTPLGWPRLLFFLALMTVGTGSAQAAGKVLTLTEKDHGSLSSLGPHVVGKPLSAHPIENTAKRMPLHGAKWTYRITSGEHKGTLQKASIAQTRRRNSNNLWSRTIHKDCTEFFSVQPNGAIWLVSEIDLKHNVITRYAPAIPVMFDGMKPGQSKEVETAVKVYDLHDPTFLKYHGKLKVTHTYLGRFPVSVPSGNYDADLIRSAYVGKVGPAHVVDGGYVFYAENAGIVASVERMHVSAFLFYDKRKKIPKVLIKN